MVIAPCLAVVLAASADPSPFSKNEPALVFGRVSSSVLVVNATVPQGTSQGSGVIVGKGLIVTNFHVVKGAARISVTQAATTVEAKLLRLDEKHDLALLSIEGLERRPVTIATAAGLGVGDHVYAVGAPHGLELTLSDGLVSSLREDKQGGAPTIQTTAPISPGSSGGGLFDGRGRLVGITTWQRQGQNLNFANPAEWVTQLLQGKGMAEAADAGRAPLFTVTSRPKDVRCQIAERSTWGLFSDGPELLESQPYKREVTFWDLDGQTPRRGSDTLVLRDLSRKSQFVDFAGPQGVQYFFVFDDDGATKLILAELVNFKGQPRLVTTSGDCAPTTRPLNGPRTEEPIASTDDDACANGNAKACLTIAGSQEGGIAVVYYRRACDGGEVVGCDRAAELYERVGDKDKAARYRQLARQLGPPTPAPLVPAAPVQAPGPRRTPLAPK